MGKMKVVRSKTRDIITEEIFRHLFRDSRELVVIHETERLIFCAKKKDVAGYAEDERLPLCGKVSSLDIITEEIFRHLFRDSRELVVIHETERLAFNAKKRTSLAGAFFGAEDEIRTRATVSHTTPLAGEPLEPLGYFCMAH